MGNSLRQTKQLTALRSVRQDRDAQPVEALVQDVVFKPTLGVLLVYVSSSHLLQVLDGRMTFATWYYKKGLIAFTRELDDIFKEREENSHTFITSASLHEEDLNKIYIVVRSVDHASKELMDTFYYFKRWYAAQHPDEVCLLYAKKDGE